MAYGGDKYGVPCRLLLDIILYNGRQPYGTHQCMVAAPAYEIRKTRNRYKQ